MNRDEQIEAAARVLVGEEYHPISAAGCPACEVAITALRAALALPVAPLAAEAGPVAWNVQRADGGWVYSEPITKQRAEEYAQLWNTNPESTGKPYRAVVAPIQRPPPAPVVAEVERNLGVRGKPLNEGSPNECASARLDSTPSPSPASCPTCRSANRERPLMVDYQDGYGNCRDPWHASPPVPATPSEEAMEAARALDLHLGCFDGKPWHDATWMSCRREIALALDAYRARGAGSKEPS